MNEKGLLAGFDSTAKKRTRERSIEKRFTNAMARIGALVYKFESPSNSGVPDRIVIHKGRVVFVELKKPGKRLRPLQRIVIERMRSHGASCDVISTPEQVDLFAKVLDQ